MKQVVAVKRVGIISTPNQPIYRRFSVEVTHSQNRSHKDADSRRCNVVVMVRMIAIDLLSQMNDYVYYFTENVKVCKGNED